MKKLIFLPILLCAFVKIDIKPIEIGTILPNENDTLLNAMNDQKITLNSQIKENGLLVIFSCNTCPFVIANADRIRLCQKTASSTKIGMV
ncbi:MAG TPA: thioredoxin family protein, partial [Bacteroidia bacterium]|nr:thioredoxin family protein [Bacteroidia bacterium]